MTNETEHGYFDHSNPDRLRASRRVTVVSMVANLVLTVAQMIIGWIGNSQALVADGLHTLSDLVTDFMVLFALQHGHKGADAEHPYGHERIETAVSMILGIILFIVGVGIAVRAGVKLYSGEAFVMPSPLTLVTALLTLVVKEWLYHYTLRTAKLYDSNMLRANAWHHRSDALSSLVVAAGIGGTLLGFMYLDSVAAIIVGVMIVKVGGELAWVSLRELVDTGLHTEQISRIKKAITDVPDVKALHVLRTRCMGGKALVDVHIQVDSRISVSEGHHISETVRQHVIDEIDEVADVMVHIDPENDEVEAPSAKLPLRQDILPRLKQAWAGLAVAKDIREEQITLHYLAGKIRVDLVLPLRLLENEPRASQEKIARQFAQIAAQFDSIEQIDLYFH
jgi:cation diffusion facilitator family transporter